VWVQSLCVFLEVRFIVYNNRATKVCVDFDAGFAWFFICRMEEQDVIFSKGEFIMHMADALIPPIGHRMK
jgi:hypothetical protein